MQSLHGMHGCGASAGTADWMPWVGAGGRMGGPFLWTFPLVYPSRDSMVRTRKTYVTSARVPYSAPGSEWLYWYDVMHRACPGELPGCSHCST